MAIDPSEIQLTDKQRRRLAELANKTNREWTDLFEAMLVAEAAKSKAKKAAMMTAEEFEVELESLTFKGPSLPDAFSRDDIYFDHD